VRHKILKEAREALTIALKGLEETRMTRRDDPMLVELKADIRHIIQVSDESEAELSIAA
jgi:hypothetical protein